MSMCDSMPAGVGSEEIRATVSTRILEKKDQVIERVVPHEPGERNPSLVEVG